jgi:hypothetical protein
MTDDKRNAAQICVAVDPNLLLRREKIKKLDLFDEAGDGRFHGIRGDLPPGESGQNPSGRAAGMSCRCLPQPCRLLISPPATDKISGGPSLNPNGIMEMSLRLPIFDEPVKAIIFPIRRSYRPAFWAICIETGHPKKSVFQTQSGLYIQAIDFTSIHISTLFS